MKKYISIIFLLYSIIFILPYFGSSLYAQDFEVIMKPKVGLRKIGHTIRAFQEMKPSEFSRFNYTDMEGLETKIWFNFIASGDIHRSYLRDTVFLLLQSDDSGNKLATFCGIGGYDFTQEKTYRLSKDKEHRSTVIDFEVRQAVDGDTVSIRRPYSFNPFDTLSYHGYYAANGELIQFPNYVTLMEAWYDEGEYTLNGDQLEILSKTYFHTKDSIPSLTVKITKKFDSSTGIRTRDLPATISGDTDTLRFSKYRYHVRKKRDTLTFNYIDTVDLSYVADFTKKDLITGEDIQLSRFKTPYILLDFWGSWCQPCIEGIPDLKDIYTSYQGKLAVVSIAYDREDDLGKLKGLIADHGMDWYHIWEKRPQIRPDLIKQFDIKSYPTFILIDNMGNQPKIIQRYYGNNTAREIIQMLSGQIK